MVQNLQVFCVDVGSRSKEIKFLAEKCFWQHFRKKDQYQVFGNPDPDPGQELDHFNTKFLLAHLGNLQWRAFPVYCIVLHQSASFSLEPKRESDATRCPLTHRRRRRSKAGIGGEIQSSVDSVLALIPSGFVESFVEQMFSSLARHQLPMLLLGP